MLSFKSEMHVQRMRAQEVIRFMLNMTDERYQTWWPGTHLRMHALNDRLGLGQTVFMDEMVGSHHLRMNWIVTELESDRIIWQLLAPTRLPCWVSLVLQDDAQGATITHTLRAGFDGVLGKLTDPFIHLLMSARFAATLETHFTTEFSRLQDLIEILAIKPSSQSVTDAA